MFEIAAAFHLGMHILLVGFSETVGRIVYAQERAFKVIAAARKKAATLMDDAEEDVAQKIAAQEHTEALEALGKARGVNLLGSAPARVPEPVVLAHEPAAAFAREADAMPEVREGDAGKA